MQWQPWVVRLLVVLAAVPAAAPAADVSLPGDRQPLLQLNPPGATAAVTRLAIAMDAERKLVLYAGGYDKVVRAWVREGDHFVPRRTYRVPLGPGEQGAINALAVSADGRWLAAAGKGVVREALGFFEAGFVMPAEGRLSRPMLQDEGTIWVFDTQGRDVRRLRGHRGLVLALAFAPGGAGQPPPLASVAREETNDGRDHVGVLRLWNTSAARPLARAEFPDPADAKTSLALWQTDRDGSLRVALACHGQPLRLWDWAGRGSWQKVAELAQGLLFNGSVLFVPSARGAGAGSLYSCGCDARRVRAFRRTPEDTDLRARLFRWTTSGTDVPELDDSATLDLPAESFTTDFAVLGNARPIVLQSFPPRDVRADDYRYRLLLPRPGESRAAEVSLWQGGWRWPVVAVAPDGSCVAVAGGPAHEVRVYAVQDLRRGREEPQQRLHSDGVVFHRVAFARKGMDRGLLLLEEPRGDLLRDALVFDPGRRRLEQGPAGWQLDAPDRRTDDWRVDGPSDKDDRFVVWRGDEKVGEVIRLEKGQVPTRYTLLPHGPDGVPLLAIAFVEKGVPDLGIWNVASGQQVRRLTGHLNAIGALAFDAAGGRLISAALDQTVCVWNLDDLGATMGKHGAIRGLAVKQRPEDRGLCVNRIDRKELNTANVEALKDVAEEDVIEGLVQEGRLQRFDRPLDFYLALFKLKPPAPWLRQEGEPAVLRVRKPGAARERDVELQLDQGVDVHQPLFTLFVTAGTDGQERQWVGWSPEGPYDTGDLVRGERLIGWHFNTDKPTAPTAFAEAAKYHKDFYRDRILHHLLQRGSLSHALEDWKKTPADRPRTDLTIEQGRAVVAAQDASGRFIIQHTPLLLRADVLGIEPQQVQRVQWQVLRLGDQGLEEFSGPPRPLPPLANGKRQADLTDLPWRRGLYEARVLLSTFEEPPQVFTTTLALRYLPPPPTVDPLREPGEDEKSKKTYHLKARVASSARGPDAPGVDVWVRHNGKTQKTPGPDVDCELGLQEGRNHIEVEAVNQGADESALRRYESTLRSLEIVCHAPLVEIHLRSVTSVDTQETTAVGDGLVVVGARHVRLRGEVYAKEPLTKATLAIDGEEPRVLHGFFRSNHPQPLPIDEAIQLPRAGKSTLRLKVEAGSTHAHRTLVLDYLPLLPRLRLLSPGPAGADQAQTTLQIQLLPPPDPFPFQVEKVLLNRAAVHFDRDAAAHRLTVPVKLQPRANALEVFLANEYRHEKREWTIRLRQPPRVASLRQVESASPTSASFEAIVESAADLPLTWARFGRTRIDDRDVKGAEGDWHELTPDRWQREHRPDGLDRWTILLKAVPLEAGKNTFELRAANRDGPCPPQTILAEGRQPLPQRPQVSFENLPAGPTRDSRCSLRIRVRSSAAVTLTLRRNGQEVADLVAEKAGAEEGVTAFEVRQLHLEPGPNMLDAEATTPAGLSGRAQAVVVYVQETVEVYPDGFQELGEDRPRRLDEEASSGRVELLGRVEWPHESDPALKRPEVRIRVWVNDYQQLDSYLLSANKKTRKFQVRLSLNREVNDVRLVFPDIVVQEEIRFTLRCKKPLKNQRLHLWVLAPGDPDSAVLTSRVLDALGAEGREEDHFHTAAFPKATLYKPLAAPPMLPEVYQRVSQIQDAIRLEKAETIGKLPEDVNDVVLIYFRGRVRQSSGRQYLFLGPADGKPEQWDWVDCEQIRELLDDTLGAKLLILDGHATEQVDGRVADRSARVGGLTYVWLGAPNDPDRRSLIEELNRALSSSKLWGPVARQVTADFARNRKVAVRREKDPPGYETIVLKK